VLAASRRPLGLRGRLLPGAGARAETPAAYIRALDLSAERLEQTYARLPDEAGRQHYRYAAPAFDFTCNLVYDESGLSLTTRA